jgi:hypothetical protein
VHFAPVGWTADEAVMEGGVMLSRSYGSVEPFDRAVKQLRQQFALLLAAKGMKQKQHGVRRRR